MIFSKDDIRFKIADTYSRWTALSSTRSGSPLKSREDIYTLLMKVDFNEILISKISIEKEEFNEWHKKNAELLNSFRPEMQIGWTTKLINIYLKTMVYIGQFGSKELITHIHPPIDAGLLAGIKEKFQDDNSISEKINFNIKIKDIQSYEDYKNIIDVMEEIADKQNCLSIEVEQFWKGIEFKEKNNSKLEV